MTTADSHIGSNRQHRLSDQVPANTCYVHFLRNALGHLPRKLADDCLQELRWIYDRRELVEVRRDIAAWLAKWQAKHEKLCDWVEEKHRGDADLLSAAARPPQTHEVDQHARALQSGTQAAHPCGAHLSQCRELPAAGAGAGRRDPRELARRHPLFEHAAPDRA